VPRHPEGASDFPQNGLRKTAPPEVCPYSRYAPQMEFKDAESNRKETETDTE